jgi:membrane peptidoglycan carboxypeptidase
MSPFNGHPEGCSPATLALLDQALMDAWRELLTKNEAGARTAGVDASRHAPRVSHARDRGQQTSRSATHEPRAKAAQSPSEAPPRSLRIPADRSSSPTSSSTSSLSLRPKEGKSPK